MSCCSNHNNSASIIMIANSVSDWFYSLLLRLLSDMMKGGNVFNALNYREAILTCSVHEINLCLRAWCV